MQSVRVLLLFLLLRQKEKVTKRKRRLFLNRSAQKKGLCAGLLILTKCSAALTFSFASPKRKVTKEKAMAFVSLRSGGLWAGYLPRVL